MIIQDLGIKHHPPLHSVKPMANCYTNTQNQTVKSDYDVAKEIEAVEKAFLAKSWNDWKIKNQPTLAIVGFDANNTVDVAQPAPTNHQFLIQNQLMILAQIQKEQRIAEQHRIAQYRINQQIQADQQFAAQQDRQQILAQQQVQADHELAKRLSQE